MQSEATTISDYLAELPADRRAAIEIVRHTILENLPEGYEEVINWGMITYQVPLKLYSDTYNGKPLMYVALASQKNHMAVYLTGIYMDKNTRRKFEEDYRASGKKFDVGKSCVQFKQLTDLPVDLIGKSIAAFTPAEFIEHVKKVTSDRKTFPQK